MDAEHSDEHKRRTYAAFVEAQKTHGAQSMQALTALRNFRKAIGVYKAPPPGAIEIIGG